MTTSGFGLENCIFRWERIASALQTPIAFRRRTLEAKRNASFLEHPSAVVQHPNFPIRPLLSSLVALPFHREGDRFVGSRRRVVEKKNAFIEDESGRAE